MLNCNALIMNFYLCSYLSGGDYRLIWDWALSHLVVFVSLISCLASQIWRWQVFERFIWAFKPINLYFSRQLTLFRLYLVQNGILNENNINFYKNISNIVGIISWMFTMTTSTDASLLTHIFSDVNKAVTAPKLQYVRIFASRLRK